MQLEKRNSAAYRFELAALQPKRRLNTTSMDSENHALNRSSIILSALQSLLITGALPEDLPDEILADADFRQIASSVEWLHASLQMSRESLDMRTTELENERKIALDLMADAQVARQEVEATNAALETRLQEIQALQAQLREQAIHDPITGCFNRRYLEETFHREISRAQRENYPLSLVMVDIDHFKQVNDTYGHPAGDAVLQALGILLRGQTRAGDIVCRYGGDEFLLVLPNMKQADVLNRAEAWRIGFRELEIFYGDVQVQATISLGIATTPEDGANADEMVRAVDKALYRAKHAGRDCVRPPE